VSNLVSDIRVTPEYLITLSSDGILTAYHLGEFTFLKEINTDKILSVYIHKHQTLILTQNNTGIEVLEILSKSNKFFISTFKISNMTNLEI